MKKIAICILLVVFLLSVTLGTAVGFALPRGNNRFDKDYKFVLICPNKDHADSWGKVIAGIEEADEELGVTTEILGGNNYANYKRDVLLSFRQVLDREILPDAILAYCGIEDDYKPDGYSMVDLLAEAQQKGVPVIALGGEATQAGQNYRAAYIGTNYGTLSSRVANFMNKICDDNAKVGTILNDRNSVSEAVAAETFQREIQKYGITLQSSLDAGNVRVVAKQKAEQMLTQYPDLDALFVSGAENAEGVCDYLKDVKTQYPNLKVLVEGESADLIQYIKDGVLDAMYVQQYHRFGYMGVYYAYEYLDAGYLPASSYTKVTSLVTKDNVDTYNNQQVTKTVRIGYYNDPAGIFQKGSNDSERKSGYAYDFYQEIASIANWKYTYVYCESAADALQKLNDNQVDIVAGVNRTTENYNIKKMFISEDSMGFGGVFEQLNDRHFSVTRVDLLNDLNNALHTIRIDKPLFAMELYQKYYKNVTIETLSTEQKNWLSARGVLKIGYVNNNMPISDTDTDGTPTGLVGDVFDEFNEFTPKDITVSYIAFNSVDEMETALKERKIDVIFPVYADYWLTEMKGFKQTETVFSDRLMMIFKNNDGMATNDRLQKVAGRPVAVGMRMYLQSLYPTITVETDYYDTLINALAAVNRGDAYCAVGCASIIQQRWGRIDHEGFTLVSLEATANFAMSVHSSDSMLVEILNIFINQLDEGDITNALVKYSVVETPVTFTDFMKANVWWFVTVAFIIVAVIAVIFALYLHRTHIFKREQAKSHAALQEAFELAEKANKAKTNFLSSMSHDIRTPMNAIVGMTSIATTHIDDKARVKDCLEKITISSNHLLTLINDVLDISKIESGKLAFNPIIFSLRDVMANLVNIVRPMIGSNNLQFDVHIQGVEYEYLFADEVRLNQIFINILSNAVKYTPAGGKVVLDLIERPLEDGKNVELTYIVQDTGIGMSKEFLANMYETFARAEDSRINKIQGTGLGLAIVKQMVTKMGGTIDCESQLNVGTKFTIKLTLPIAEKDVEKQVLPSNVHVLVVDDDEIFLDSTHEALKELGATADTVNGGEKALKLLKEHQENPYSVAIVDWKMPDMSGLDTIKGIRKIIGHDTPIILMSAYDWEDIENQAKDAGINGFISKPLFRSYIYEKMCEVLKIGTETSTVSFDTDSDLKGLHVLVAEDNDLNWEVISELLDMYEITADHAINGQVCVDMLSNAAAGQFDLVLMDVQMPVMNGRDATRAIRADKRERINTIPVIAMTADAFAEDIAACLDAGMDGHVSKPVNMDKLLQEIRRVLSARNKK